ncbi:hypothetical protein [Mesobacillus zeae]|uniref:Uncharacterized protein n=1 Tax=Mesobacillus zeae TaxID=1917180 RepID=A0A398AWJ8_9BACI|nr:hypothetical protein [Mesobacillus zeae]RID82012.1 hypothetical protein D1970_20035 [Mesobacillus zeae]
MTIVDFDFVDGPNAAKLKGKAYREDMYECVVRAACRREGARYFPVKSKYLNQSQMLNQQKLA